MSGLFGNLFGTTTPPAAPPAPTAQPVQPPGTNIPPAAGATDPANPTVPPVTTDPASPLSEFSKLWDNAGVQKPNEPIFGKIDPKLVMDSAKQTDFSKGVPPELLEKVKAGGDGAVEATLAVMNSMSQAAFANSAMASTKLIEQALAKQQERFEAMLPDIIKKHTVSENLRGENPLFNNPAVAPLLKAIEHQFTVLNPSASSTEITASAKKYIESLGQVFAPATKPADTTTTSKAEDWSQFFLGSPS